MNGGNRCTGFQLEAEERTHKDRGERTRILRHEDKIARTGDHCPTPGAWQSAAAPGAPVELLRGEIMPPLDGGSVLWRLVAAGTKTDY